MKYWIISDVSSDLGSDFLNSEERLSLLPMEYELGNETKLCTCANEAEIKELYDNMRQGKLTKTSQVNHESSYSRFKEIAKKGEAILCITLSSKVSGTFSSVNLAKNMVLEEIPDARIEVIDSKSGSLGLGLLLRYMKKFRDKGHSLEECIDFTKELIPHIEHIITFSDLKHLLRGGRLTKGSATIGSLLKIQPLIHVDESGKLVSVAKQIGRKRAIRELSRLVDSRAEKDLKGSVIESVSGEKQDIIIGHSDCMEDALELKDLLSKLDFIGNVDIMPIGCVIGSHSGAGTLAVFFYGKTRKWDS